jgi:hypothetical protein
MFQFFNASAGTGRAWGPLLCLSWFWFLSLSTSLNRCVFGCVCRWMLPQGLGGVLGRGSVLIAIHAGGRAVCRAVPSVHMNDGITGLVVLLLARCLGTDWVCGKLSLLLNDYPFPWRFPTTHLPRATARGPMALASA